MSFAYFPCVIRACDGVLSVIRPARHRLNGDARDFVASLGRSGEFTNPAPEVFRKHYLTADRLWNEGSPLALLALRKWGPRKCGEKARGVYVRSNFYFLLYELDVYTTFRNDL